MIHRRWRRNWIVITAIVVHFGWGVLLLFSAEPLHTTPMAATPFRHNQYVGAVIYLVAALAALWPIVRPKYDGGFVGLACCLPQQFLLMYSAGSAIRCVLRGMYADLVPRPWEFILADQLWVIVGMVFHSFSLLDWYWFSRERSS